MQKKLLVLLIAVVPALMPNLASAVAIEIDGVDFGDLYDLPHVGKVKVD